MTRQASTIINKQVFEEELGLKQFKNTTIFTKGTIFIISPSVQNSHWWFDLRKVNLERYYEKNYKGYLVIRLLNKFLLTDLDPFLEKMITEKKFAYTKNTGVHWKFIIKLDDGIYKIVSLQDRNKLYNIDEVTSSELKARIINIKSTISG